MTTAIKDSKQIHDFDKSNDSVLAYDDLTRERIERFNKYVMSLNIDKLPINLCFVEKLICVSIFIIRQNFIAIRNLKNFQTNCWI